MNKLSIYQKAYGYPIPLEPSFINRRGLWICRSTNKVLDAVLIPTVRRSNAWPMRSSRDGCLAYLTIYLSRYCTLSQLGGVYRAPLTSDITGNAQPFSALRRPAFRLARRQAGIPKQPRQLPPRAKAHFQHLILLSSSDNPCQPSIRCYILNPRP